ncbi:uncharacterized protein [Musca autumnalis]|uniref:uncharacterized protein n=1 Tax=Musca autumnalis TaxID=221902 RepID=UPI003CEF810C
MYCKICLNEDLRTLVSQQRHWKKMNTLHTAYLNEIEKGNCKNFASYIKLMDTLTEDMLDSEEATVSDLIDRQSEQEEGTSSSKKYNNTVDERIAATNIDKQ